MKKITIDGQTYLLGLKRANRANKAYRQLIRAPHSRTSDKPPVITDTFYLHLDGQGPIVTTPSDGDIIIDAGNSPSLKQYWKIYQYRGEILGFVYLETQTVSKTEY